ncbi:MAG: hypothetical protein ACLURV_08910 [Gallintestinimicrobium sp.]
MGSKAIDFITVVGTLINMLITTMAAYVLSKKDLKDSGSSCFWQCLR